MRKHILLAAVAATVMSTGAIAQPGSHARHEGQRMDRHAMRLDRHAMRMDRHATRADRHAMRMDRRAMRIDRGALSANRHAMHRVRSAYIAPVRNWTYRPVTVGYRLEPSFYSSRYYITDYGTYHLRAPHARALQWIRYGNDLLLVNVRTGRVLQVIHYRYW